MKKIPIGNDFVLIDVIYRSLYTLTLPFCGLIFTETIFLEGDNIWGSKMVIYSIVDKIAANC